MKKNTDRVSLGKVARLAGVSTTAAGFALQNLPGVSEETRGRILRIAKELGYVPDARIDNWMARVRDAKSKDLLPIVWLNTALERDAWQRHRFLSPYLEGARGRALDLGYKLEEIWYFEKGMTARRLSEILYKRGINGIIVTHPLRHLRLDWKYLASVALGGDLRMPKLHQIMHDLNFNLYLALKSLKRLGFQRIGICLSQAIVTATHYNFRATARDLYFNASAKERIPPLFLTHVWGQGADWEGQMHAWLKRYKPEVIVGHDNRLKQWAEAAGYRVPEDLGIVLLALDDDVPDWAGIHSRRREMGATAVDWLVSLMRNYQFGIPNTPLNITIRGTWRTGITLKSHPANTCG